MFPFNDMINGCFFHHLPALKEVGENLSYGIKNLDIKTNVD